MRKSNGGTGAKRPVSERTCPGHPAPRDSSLAAGSALSPVRLPLWFYTVLLLFTLAVLFAVRRLAGITYFINDDIAMRDIVSGAYTGSPDTHIIFILRPIAVLLQRLFVWHPAVDWYALWMTGCHGLCLFVLLILAARWAAVPGAGGGFGDYNRRRRPALPARVWCAIPAAVAVFLALDAHALVMIQFTTVAAVLCWTAVAVLLVPHRVFCPMPRTVLAGALLLLSYNTRPNVCLLSLPFVAAAVWWQLSSARSGCGAETAASERLQPRPSTGQNSALPALRRRLRPAAARPVFIAAAAIAALGVASGAFDAAQYRSEDWQQYRQFSRARAFLYDYVEIPDYRAAEPDYRAAGLGETTVNLIRDYNLMSDPAVTAEQLNRVQVIARAADPAAEAEALAGGETAAAAVRTGSGQIIRVLLRRFQTAVQSVLALVEHDRLKLYVYWSLLLLVLSLAFNRGASVLKTVLQNLLWPAIGFAELLFLAWSGRMPERVAMVPLALITVPLLIVCVGGIGARAAGGGGGCPVGRRRLYIAAAAGLGLSLLLIAGFHVAGAREHYERYTRYHSRYREAVELVGRTDPDGVYFYNVGTMDFSFPQMEWRNVPFDGRFLTLGGWRSRSPVQAANWARHGLDPAEGAGAMLNNGVYFVASDAAEAAHIRDYLNERSGGVRVELLRVIDENGYYFECYRFLPLLSEDG